MHLVQLGEFKVLLMIGHSPTQGSAHLQCGIVTPKSIAHNEPVHKGQVDVGVNIRRRCMWCLGINHPRPPPVTESDR
jgi:hypothetical protein